MRPFRSAAIGLGGDEWRDVVVSCRMLTERDRRQLSKMSALVKIVCLEAAHATGRTPVPDQSVRIVTSEFSAEWHVAREPGQDVLTVDSSRKVKEIMEKKTEVLIRRTPSCFARRACCCG